MDEQYYVIALLELEPVANDERTFATLEEAEEAALQLAIHDLEPWAVYDELSGDRVSIAYDFELYRK